MGKYEYDVSNAKIEAAFGTHINRIDSAFERGQARASYNSLHFDHPLRHLPASAPAQNNPNRKAQTRTLRRMKRDLVSTHMIDCGDRVVWLSWVVTEKSRPRLRVRESCFMLAGIGAKTTKKSGLRKYHTELAVLSGHAITRFLERKQATADDLLTTLNGVALQAALSPHAVRLEDGGAFVGSDGWLKTYLLPGMVSGVWPEPKFNSPDEIVDHIFSEKYFLPEY